MESFIGDAKVFYDDFFYMDAWNENMAKQILNGKSFPENRAKVIRYAYDSILSNAKVDDIVKKYIKSKHSMRDTAELNNEKIGYIKNHVYYANNTIGKMWTYKDKNIIRYLLTETDISMEDWKEIDKIVVTIRLRYGRDFLKEKPLITNRNVLVNIPKKAYNTEVSDARFNHFLNLIKPYMIEERKRVQKIINEEMYLEAGYFNYLMTPGVYLSDLDKKRYKEIKGLLDPETAEQLDRVKRNEIGGLADKAYNEEKKARQKEIDQIIDEDERVMMEIKNAAEKIKSGEEKSEYKSKHIQYDF